MLVSVLGGAGYIGGELLRLLLNHPKVKIHQITSNALAGKPIYTSHPNLRGKSELVFDRHGTLKTCDILFLAGPHGYANNNAEKWSSVAPTVIDLSADFRIKNRTTYKSYYGEEAALQRELDAFISGIPEIFRDELKSAERISIPGCMATPSILSLHPFAAENLLFGTVHVDARTGSSGSGAQHSAASHHPERSGSMRVFKPAGHRHEAEISQSCGRPVIMSATGVEAVRGVQVVIRAKLKKSVSERDIWHLYRQYYANEPFLRIVKRSRGLHRLPDPKLLSGTNYCDIGFEVAGDGKHVVLISAVDNLVKGGAGAAVQSMNVRHGWDETLGLSFPGLHPN